MIEHKNKNNIEDLDISLYDVNPRVIDSLFDVEEFSHIILNPACGNGNLSRRMEEFKKLVILTDLYNGYGNPVIDFLNCNVPLKHPVDIISNPPFLKAKGFTLRAIDLTYQKTAMLLPVEFLDNIKNDRVFSYFSPKSIYIFENKIKYLKNMKSEEDWKDYFDGDICLELYLAWFVWDKQYHDETIIREIKIQEREGKLND